MAKGIYKRGNVYWMRYAGLDGKIIFESTGSDKFKVAETMLIDRKDAVKKGNQPDTKRIEPHTFRELAEQYKAWMQGRHRSADSKRYRIDIITAHFGNLPLAHINTLAVERYQTIVIKKGMKPATVNKHISIIKAMIKKAVDWNMASDDTLKSVRAVKMLTENNKRLRFISHEECRALIDACTKRIAHLKPVIVTALNTGMRKEEILSLKWEQLDLKHGFILIDRTKNGERREIPLNDTLQNTFRGMQRRLDVPWVFYDPFDGKRYNSVKHSFKEACRRAGIVDFRFHDLRHTFASHLCMAGVDLKTVQELLGHKTLTMTLRYAHLAPGHKRKAVDILDKQLRDTATIQKLYNLEKSEATVNA